MIVIVDYNLGNKGSISNMIKKIGYEAIVTDDIAIIEKADKLILPGVGAFDDGMRNLSNLGLIPILKQKVLQDKTPILGICLGMQLLCNSSEEGELPGIGFLNTSVIRFPKDISGIKLRIPHLGWNTVSKNNTSTLLNGIENPRFYFVHSYYCLAQDSTYKVENTSFGLSFHSYIQHENIYGVQFHPEKSHSNGKKLLQNFIELS
jgi:imidazole glycerol-phosphate synthase subunit HisH